MCLYHSTMCTRHPDLVSFDFYAIPIFHIIIVNLLVNHRNNGFAILYGMLSLGGILNNN